MPSQIDQFQRDLNYRFTNPGLAKTALTHRSASASHNERLEFLGDSLLGYIVAEFLYENYPNATEGALSRMRASLVKKESLVIIARELNLGEYINLGGGEIKSGGKERDSILADAVEAIIAAVYLDGGMQSCKPLVSHWCNTMLGAEAVVPQSKDAKTRLQEMMQARSQPLPQYQVTEISGEAHQQTFHVECRTEATAFVATGSGPSKRLAEQEAAAQMLDAIGEKGDKVATAKAGDSR